MRRIVLAAAAVTLAAGTATAADLPRLPPLPPAAPVLWNWTGLYWGAHLGGSFGSSSFSDPAGTAIYGGSVRSPAALAGIQLGYNYQPSANWLVGVEADLSSLNANGTNSCLVSSGLFISANCRVRQDALATLTGRAGFVTGPGGRTLLYGKAGAAYLSQRLDITAGNPLDASTELNDGRWGWTAGAGIEQALAPAWSVKFEYDYANFGTADMTTPSSYRLVPGIGYFATPQGISKVSQDLHAVKVGLNLKFGGDADARFDDYHLRGSQTVDGVVERGAVEVGGRVWYSSGRFQKDLGATVDQGLQTHLISRLTYQSTAASGEAFGRIDGPYNLFLKGLAGGGKLLSGHMNDEDWIANDGIPYSNTLSDPVKGNIAYATIDAGYNLLRGPGYKFGGFIGYNYFRENKSAYGCTQTAGATSQICADPISSSVLAMTQNNTWHSLRVGLSGEIGLGYGLKLSADAAYLPYVKTFGTDNHVMRTDVTDTVSPEQGAGQGVQLEAILSYQLNNAFSVGAGARYWAMWTTTDAFTNIFGSQCPCQTLPERTERYGTFLQASYKFDALNDR